MTKQKFNPVFPILNMVLPGLCIVLLAWISFWDSFVEYGLMIISLVIIYPILFFWQGLLCAHFRGHIYYTLGVSTGSFVLTAFIWLNMTALPYLLMYNGLAAIGYLIIRRIQKSNRLRY